MGDYGANADVDAPMVSGVPTQQAGRTDLEVYLDPNDAIGDGSSYNAVLRVNGGNPIRGLLASVSASTTITEVRLIRNVDDEVLFDDLTIETTCVPPAVLDVLRDGGPRSDGRLAAYPNPFGSRVGVRLSLPAAADVRVAVYDVAGRLVRTLHTGRIEPGDHEIRWDGLDSAGRSADAGLYFVRARSGDRILSTRIARVR
jgi:hypothetical protein